jgi:hypothetical protein
VANEPNNKALEFETMLRRHLKNGGAPVAACNGFDFDAASAYLENALGKSARSGFETHLSGCAACRRHLIELGRLSQLSQQQKPQRTPRPMREPVLVRWKETVSAWFDFLDWNWKWQMAGAGAAAAALLIAALSVQSWQRSARLDETASSPVQDSLIASIPATPAPSPSLSEGSGGSGGSGGMEEREFAGSLYSDSTNNSGVPLRARIPAPANIAPKQQAREFQVIASNKSLRLPASSSDPQLFDFRRGLPAGQPPFTLPEAAPPRPSVVSQGIGGRFAQPAVASESSKVEPPESNRAEVAATLDDAAAGADRSRTDLTARISPPEDINPMRSGSSGAGSAGSAKVSAKPASPVRSGLVGRVMSFAPIRKADLEKKSSIKDQDDESIKPLTVRIRDKVFSFERGIWIDQAYKPSMQWRMLKLERGSKEYERIVTGEPLLKEFFEHGPIIVVWKDRIYKVLDR